ncbi:MAG TPA: hypothetical protein VGH03_02475 [Caulobacteraceae bacterium]
MARNFASPLDYGARRRPRQVARMVLPIVVIGLAAAALVGLWAMTRAARMDHARVWTASGPPCATAKAPTLAAAGETPTQAQTYGGVLFLRTHGAIRCTEIGYDGGRSDNEFPVCQFDHPGGLAVTTSRGTWLFAPSPLHAATVQVRHDIPECVVSGVVWHFDIPNGQAGWSAAPTVVGGGNAP